MLLDQGRARLVQLSIALLVYLRILRALLVVALLLLLSEMGEQGGRTVVYLLALLRVFVASIKVDTLSLQLLGRRGHQPLHRLVLDVRADNLGLLVALT